MSKALGKTGGRELLGGLAESPGKFPLLFFGEGANPFGEGFCLNEADGNCLVAAMGAALLAGDWLSGSSQIRGNIFD
jgi:hypothetical protein